MRGPPDEPAFTFINYRGPYLPRGRNVLRSIRKQAMKDVAATRKSSGNFGKQNAGQYPVFLGHDGALGKTDVPSEAAIRSRTGCDNEQNAPLSNTEAATKQMPSGPDLASSSQHTTLCHSLHPEFALSESTFLLLHMAPLTGLRLGITNSSTLKEAWQHKNKVSVPQPGTRKLLSFIPSRYNHVASLRHATDCVTAKLRHMLQESDSRPANGEALILQHYASAVRAVRAALEDEQQRLMPETLCATKLLSAFEVRRSC